MAQGQEEEVDLVPILLKAENPQMKVFMTMTLLAKDLNLLKAEEAQKMVKEDQEISAMMTHLDFVEAPNLVMVEKAQVQDLYLAIWLMKTKFNLGRVPKKALEQEDPEDLVILVMIEMGHVRVQKMDPEEIQVIF